MFQYSHCNVLTTFRYYNECHRLYHVIANVRGHPTTVYTTIDKVCDHYRMGKSAAECLCYYYIQAGSSLCSLPASTQLFHGMQCSDACIYDCVNCTCSDNKDGLYFSFVQPVLTLKLVHRSSVQSFLYI